MAEEKRILRNEKILVVDDISKWLKVAEDNLNYYGCKNIITSKDPDEAFKKYREQNPTFSLIDINFDKNDITDTRGLDLIQKLRECGYSQPIIAMSSFKNVEERSINAGANCFINKKFFVKDFDNFITWYASNKK